MPELHPVTVSLIQTTVIVVGACALVLQAVRFLIAAVMQVADSDG